MAKKLRRKFIIIAVSAVFVVLLLLAGVINLAYYQQMEEHSEELLEILAENEGYFPKKKDNKDYDLPPHMSEETPFSTRYFTVKTDKNDECIMVDTGKIRSVSTSDAAAYAKELLQKDEESGFYKNYMYLISEKNYGNLTIFLDCSMELRSFFLLIRISSLVCITGTLAVFLLVLILSPKAIAPVVKSYEKQKQFITDASHELKTPLAIINTNTEVIEMEQGENDWTKSIHNQVNKLSKLVENLIVLSRMDEEKHELQKTDFSISDAVEETCEAFQSLAVSNNKRILLQVEKNLTYCGNESSLRQLLSILLDNAVKYGASGSLILVTLKKQGSKYILETSNEAEGLKTGSYDIIFERFYRMDTSRNSKSGGYGIGLSIANAIVKKHKGKITANSPDGKKLVITVIL